MHKKGSSLFSVDLPQRHSDREARALRDPLETAKNHKKGLNPGSPACLEWVLGLPGGMPGNNAKHGGEERVSRDWRPAPHSTGRFSAPASQGIAPQTAPPPGFRATSVK
jgi:hypothetical protein